MKSLCLLVSLSLLVSSCASIFNGTTERIHVRSDVPGTKLYLNNKEIGTQTASFQIAKKRMDEALISARKEGCGEAVTEIDTKFNPNTLWGILIDLGIISIFVVDWAINGATQEAERRDYVLNPTCKHS